MPSPRKRAGSAKRAGATKRSRKSSLTKERGAPAKRSKQPVVAKKRSSPKKPSRTSAVAKSTAAPNKRLGGRTAEGRAVASKRLTKGLVVSTLADPANVAPWFAGCLRAYSIAHEPGERLRVFAPFVPHQHGASASQLVEAFLEPMSGVARMNWVDGLKRGLLNMPIQTTSPRTFAHGITLIAEIDSGAAVDAFVRLAPRLAGYGVDAMRASPVALAALSACHTGDLTGFERIKSTLVSRGLWMDEFVVQEIRVRLTDPIAAAGVLSENEETLRRFFEEDVSRLRLFSAVIYSQLSLPQLLLFAIKTPAWFADVAIPAWFGGIARLRLAAQVHALIIHDDDRESSVASDEIGASHPDFDPNLDKYARQARLRAISHDFLQSVYGWHDRRLIANPVLHEFAPKGQALLRVVGGSG